MAYLLDKFNYTSIMNKAPSDAGFLYPYLIILPLNILIYSLIGLAPFFLFDLEYQKSFDLSRSSFDDDLSVK